MKRAFAVIPFAFLLSTGAEAATQQECQSLWKTVDVDTNGALTADEDKKGYIAAVQKNGVPLAKPGTVSRDEFLQACQKGFANVATESPANTKDFGKGDLTPGKNPLSQTNAQKKLEASGFRNIRDLKLDDKGIWHATAFADGQDKPVAIDQQGDIVSNRGSETPSKAQPEATQDRGVAGNHNGLFLWVWLILANALAGLILSKVGGETSAMSRSNLTLAERM